MIKFIISLAVFSVVITIIVSLGQLIIGFVLTTIAAIAGGFVWTIHKIKYLFSH